MAASLGGAPAALDAFQENLAAGTYLDLDVVRMLDRVAALPAESLAARAKDLAAVVKGQLQARREGEDGSSP